jgi:uncharacterized protein (TIGR00290 family)
LAGLLSTTSGKAEKRRISIHGVRMALTRAQAKAVGLPLHLVPLPDPCTNADYERAMATCVEQAVGDGITHIAFGDLFLEDVRRYREDRLAGTGITPLFPLWGLDTTALAGAMITAGVKARLISVDLDQLDETFLGCEYDQAFMDALPSTCDPCGENGEFHSFASAGPAFDHSLEIKLGTIRRSDDGRFVHVEPRLAH